MTEKSYFDFQNSYPTLRDSNFLQKYKNVSKPFFMDDKRSELDNLFCKYLFSFICPARKDPLRCGAIFKEKAHNSLQKYDKNHLRTDSSSSYMYAQMYRTELLNSSNTSELKIPKENHDFVN